ncbi:hypothetical protein [Streptosporangium jomthongense]|uniref:DUF4325 domain-containing protein n=1 Tax=Streptosporangium jomthongense TaxID=1193683 RepID=A0ABV8FFJ3_9ACTN
MPPARRTTQSKVITQDGTPVSLFSLRARKREAVAEPFVFDVDGEFFTMKPPASTDWQVVADLNGGNQDLRKFLAELLGEDYPRFCKVPDISAEDVNALIEACTEHYQGLSRGE